MAAFITHSLTSTLSAAFNAFTFLAALLYDSSCFLQSQLALSAAGKQRDLNLYLPCYYEDRSGSTVVCYFRSIREDTGVTRALVQPVLLSQTDGDT